MNKGNQNHYLVAVIGAGPAGLYAAHYMARHGIQVVLFNREIKPGGLVEYGIYPSKHKLRQGLKAQFRRILEMPEVHYFGNVTVSESGDIGLEQLRAAGFNAFMVTTGAQINSTLGLPGENLTGVYHANDIVFHYNRLPKHAQKELDIGHKVAIIGVGNVMLDIVTYLKQRHQPYSVTAYARRGPAEVKFDNKSLEPVAECLKLDAIRQAVDEARPEEESVGKDINQYYSILEKARQRAGDCHSKIKFSMQFLLSPRHLLPDDAGRVKAIVFERNHLIKEGDRVVSKGTGEMVTVPVNTVIFSIGSQVDAGFGLPVAQGNYLTTETPRFPIDGISYEVYNKDLCSTCKDVFVSGWARVAGEGVVGLARRDAERGARALMKYLDTLPTTKPLNITQVLQNLPEFHRVVVTFEDLKRLWDIEEKLAAERGLPEFKFDSQEAMLKAIKQNKSC